MESEKQCGVGKKIKRKKVERNKAGGVVHTDAHCDEKDKVGVDDRDDGGSKGHDDVAERLDAPEQTHDAEGPHRSAGLHSHKSSRSMLCDKHIRMFHAINVSQVRS